MNYVPVLVVVGILLLFSLVVYSMILSARKDVAKKAEIALSLGFSAWNPDHNLLEQMVSVQPPDRWNDRYELKNVFRKSVPEGLMFLFDLINISGDEGGQTETQLVAVISPELNLPHFALFPQADVQGWAAGVANRVMKMAIGHSAALLEFSENPDFQKKYLLATWESETARRFFDPQVLAGMAQTRLLNVYARGNLFILSSLDPSLKSLDQRMIADRIDKAVQVFHILQQRVR
jgi:hypothetical protein